MKLIEIKNLYKTYHTPTKEINALNNINFDIYDNEILSIVGPSGCGKSTILNILTNLLSYKGNIKLKKDLNIGYMIQEDTILPWLTVKENALLGLKIKHMLTKENINYVYDLLTKYELYNFKDEYPDKLSGGMRQRLNLVRAISTKPNILLLDEPFSKLDNHTKTQITDDVYKIIKDLKITTLLITHNINEALSFSDRIIVLSKRPSNIKKIIKLENNNIPSNTKINNSLVNDIEGLLNE